MASMNRFIALVAVALVLQAALSAAQGGVPIAKSRVKIRQQFSLQDMAVDLFGQRPVVDRNGVQVRQVTEKEMPVLGLLYQLEQVQHRLIDMQPCSANVPSVAPKHAVFNYGLKGKTSVGVIQNRQAKALNVIAKEQATFFPQGMVFFEANLDCEPAQVFQVLASIRAQDIFPESQLIQSSTAQIATQFGVSAQEAAAIKSAAQANSQADPFATLLTQCKAKCANRGGGANNGGNGATSPAKGGSTQPAKDGNVGGNLQRFSGALGGVRAPSVTKVGNQFQVEGNAMFSQLSSALGRSCAVQKNKCADAANASGNRNGFTVGACDQQHRQCEQFQQA